MRLMNDVGTARMLHFAFWVPELSTQETISKKGEQASSLLRPLSE